MLRLLLLFSILLFVYLFYCIFIHQTYQMICASTVRRLLYYIPASRIFLVFDLLYRKKSNSIYGERKPKGDKTQISNKYVLIQYCSCSMYYYEFVCCEMACLCQCFDRIFVGAKSQFQSSTFASAIILSYYIMILLLLFFQGAISLLAEKIDDLTSCILKS